MKVLSLFDGISCARVALERAGIHVEEYFASEIDKYAIQISQKNYPDIIQMGSIIDICYQNGNLVGFEDLDIFNTKIDLLIGGSPCQDLSIAKRNRQGLSGERSGLFWEYVRILREVKPKWFILENVASMPKEAKETITKELGVEPIMINASLVSAQNRKRLFWTNIPGVTQPEDRVILLKEILERGVDMKYYLSGSRVSYVLNRPKNFEVKIDPEKTNTLRSNYGNASANETYVSIPNKSYVIDANYWKGTSWQHYNEKKVRQLIKSKSGVRKLTPVECERLQGLPDNYTEGVSNTQRYKMLGNAFNVDVVAHILSFIPKV